MPAGLDVETLEFTLESVSEFARRELPDSLLIELDERDEFPEQLVRRMCGEDLGGPAPVRARGVRRDGRLGHGRLPRLRADGRHRSRHRHVCAGHLPGQRPDRRGRHPGAEAALDEPHRGRGRPHGLRGDGARCGQRPGRAEDHRPTGHRGRARGRLHAQRRQAAIEETAQRIDDGEGALNTEGAIAKYLATEAGNAAADAAIQALGGYGYTHEYLVEKIRRDVRITTIYEGTSEIMEMTIARDRWQQHLKTRGGHYHAVARELEGVHGRLDAGAPTSPPSPTTRRPSCSRPAAPAG